MLLVETYLVCHDAHNSCGYVEEDLLQIKFGVILSMLSKYQPRVLKNVW